MGESCAQSHHARIGGTKGGYGITAGPDGALWFAESNSAIGRIDIQGNISRYPLPTYGNAKDITAGPDGALWFTENYGSVPSPVTGSDGSLPPG